jgi:UPF0755 protein
VDRVNKEDEQVDSEIELPETPKKRNTLRNVLVTILIIMFLIAGFAVGIGLFVVNALNPVEPAEEPVRIMVKSGMHSSEIAGLLNEQGLIKNETIFKYYLRYKNEGSRFQAGEYEMKPGMTLDEIIAKLNQGDVIKEEMIRFTIPEGYTIQQIADKLSAEGFVNKETFLEWAERPEHFNTVSVQHIPDDESLKHRLEGYLFPDTYEMKKDSTEEDIMERMLLEMDYKLTQLPKGWEGRLVELGITFHEMMTIASLIEREVVVDRERPIVSGVIYNRLSSGDLTRLQIDATIQYDLDKPKEHLLLGDLEVDSPYNTYKIEGLPPGPISSPSLKSIEAALYPEYPDDTKYYYYVTKKDGTQEHLFAETHDQHVINKRNSQSN